MATGFGRQNEADRLERKIEPRNRLVDLSLNELRGYQDLFYFLIWRDILVRYKQTFLGVGWAIVQPLAAMVIFTIIFGRLVKVPSEGAPYALFSYSALVLWTFFSQSLSQAANSLVLNERLVTKIYFPRVIIPVAAVLSYVPDFIIAWCLLMILIPFYGLGITLQIWILPFAVLMGLMTAMGAAFWTAALNVKYRDFRYIVPFLTQLWLFASPVVYPVSVIPEYWRVVYALNPMVGAIEGFRWAVLGIDTNPWPLMAIGAATCLILIGTGIIYFQRAEEFFADWI